MAIPSALGEYKIGGISEALGVSSSPEKAETTVNKLQALFEEGNEGKFALSDVGDVLSANGPNEENSKKRAFDGKNSDQPSRKKQRENRKEKKVKIQLKKDAEDPERLARTIFVGNIPLTTTKKELKNLFTPFGEVETIRLRSVPVANAKDKRKVAIIKKEFHPDRDNMNAYIVFKDAGSVDSSLKKNGMEVAGKHLRIDSVIKKEQKTKYSVFVGNMPFNIQEDKLRECFAACGEIDNVRIIRDQATGLGKGFGYVAFQNQDSVTFALKMNNCELLDRKLRVFPAVGKDNVKKQFNKKKDRAFRMKDIKSVGKPSRGTDKDAKKFGKRNEQGQKKDNFKQKKGNNMKRGISSNPSARKNNTQHKKRN